MKLEVMNIRRVGFILALLYIALSNTTIAAAEKVIKLPQRCRDVAQYGLPSSNVRLLCKTRFLIGYSDETKTPLWTIERLGRSRIPISTGHEIRRFEEDFDIPAEFRASLSDYVNSGFDRGHLVAAGNYVDDLNAFRETFLLSNVAPQVGPGFNRGIWRALEEEIRNLAQCTDELIIYTALVFPTSREPRRAIGKGRIGVPSAFVKVAYLPQARSVLTFYAENREHVADVVDSLLVTVNDIELVTGYDFFKHLPPNVEKELEAAKAQRIWSILRQGDKCTVVTN